MSLPLPKDVHAHQMHHGGLWLVVPAERDWNQPRPVIVKLETSAALGCIWFEGKTQLEDVIAENEDLRGAEWVPIDARGNMV